MFARRAALVVVFIGLLGLLVGGAVAQAATTTVIKPSSLGGWTFVDDNGHGGTVDYVTGPGTPPAGSGSLQFGVSATNQGVLDARAMSGRFDAITQLRYSTYRSSVDAGNNLALSMQLGWDNDVTDGDTAFKGRLVFEPYLTGGGSVPQGSWQEWNVLSGNGWWATKAPYNAMCSMADPCSWDDILDVWPDAGFHSVAPLGFLGFKAGSSWASFDGNVDAVKIDQGSGTTTYDFESETACTTTCYVSATTGNDAFGGDTSGSAKKTIQAAIDAVDAGGTVRVLPGTYDEKAEHRTPAGIPGDYQFGLFLGSDKDGVSVIGVDGSDDPITDAGSTLATIDTNATNSFGYSGIFIDADGVTFRGLTIGPNASGDNKTFEVDGDAFTLQDSVTDIPGGGSVYIDDQSVDGSNVQSYHILDNDFGDGTSVDISSGAGSTGPKSGRHIEGNTFDLGGGTWAAVSFNGSGSNVPWYTNTVGGAFIIDNDFSNGHIYIRTRADVITGQFDWQSFWEDNTFDRAVVAGPNPPSDLREYSYDSGPYHFDHVKQVGADIQPEVNHAHSGDTVLIQAGTYTEQVTIGKDLTVTGESQATTTIKAPASLSADTNGRLSIVTLTNGADVAMSKLTVAGPGPSGCGSIHNGILVRGSANLDADHLTVKDVRDALLSGCQNGNGIQVGRNADSTFGTATLDHVTVTGYQKTGIIVDGASSSATISDSTVTGAGATPLIAQNGIQISRGAVATVSHNAISGNACDHPTACGPDVLSDTESAGILLFNPGDGTTIDDDNTISGNDMGIYHVGPAGAAVDIEGNHITSNRYAGVVLDQGDATVSENSITGGTTAIFAINFSSDTDTSATLDHNVISGASGAGVHLYDDDAGDTNDVLVTGHRNSIAGNVAGVVSDITTTTRNFDCNWWGAANGPSGVGAGSGDSVSAHVTFIPWLTSSDLDGACSPVTIVTNAQDKTGNEGVAVSRSGKVSDSGATFSVFAGPGSVSQDGGGNWTWSYTSPNGPEDFPVTIRASAPNGTQVDDSFDVTIANVAPTATFNAPGSVLYGHTFSLSFTSPVDVAADLPGLKVDFDCGDGDGFHTNASNPFGCTAPSSPQTITVKGKVYDDDGGVTPYQQDITITAPHVDLSPSSYDFGNQVVGSFSAPHGFTLTNTGNAPLHISNVDFSGANHGQFGLDTDTCAGSTIPHNGTCSIAVVFEPTSTGPKVAKIRVTSDDPNSPSLFDLSGTGTTPASTGSIKIVLDGQPNRSTDFGFTGDLGAFTLDDDANPTNPSQMTVSGLSAGTYDITQAHVNGWSLVDLTCDTGESTDIPSRTATITLGAGEDVVCTFTDALRQPDGMISKKTNQNYKGDNIYSAAPVKAQTVTRKHLAQGTVAKYYVRVQNDSTAADSFKVTATSTGVGGMTVKYFRGAVDITADVTGAGYSTASQAPGTFTTIRIEISVGAHAAATSNRTVLLTATSVNESLQLDLVRAIAKR